ncbi:hypothetical protein OHA21_26910 [Actinoplanes sp. NBC_00393]|uniref:CdiA C-terminal domain-containing protein n=1 Tax=Actinoplanes sp. NBC_00393 TaxID=2975953 RepID=UPI002E2420AD
MTSTLIEAPRDSTTGLTGIGLASDIQQLADGIRSNSWVDATLGGVGASLEGLSLAIDPLGTLAAWGVAWLIEHVQPLQDALDKLAGDADDIAAHAATWKNVAAFTDTARAEYAASLRAEVAGWFGSSGDAYRTHAGDHLSLLEGITLAAGGISYAVEGAGLLVALVRGIVRDLIAEFIATLAVRLPQWLAAEGLTLGLATPFVAGQVAALVSKWVDKIQHFIRGLLSSLRKLLPSVDGLRNALDQLRMYSERLARSNATGDGRNPEPASTSPSGPPDPERTPRGDRTEAHPTRINDRGKRRENESADALVRHGYDVEQNPVPKVNGKAPDYKIEGEYFDCYAPTSENIDQIRKILSRKVSQDQAERLILNLEDTPCTADEVADLLRRRPIENLKEIIVVKDDQVTPFYPFGE